MQSVGLVTVADFISKLVYPESFIDGRCKCIGCKGKKILVPGLFASSSGNPLNSWTNYNGSGELNIISSADAITAGKYLKVGNNSGNDQSWLIANKSIPFDVTKLYRVKARIRRIMGTGTIWVGVAGRNATDTAFVNVVGANNHESQHYVAASDTVPGSSWTEYTGYFRGNGTPAGGLATNPANPALLHTNARFFRPLLIVNYQDQPGLTHIDSITVEEVEPVGLAQLDATLIQGGYIKTSLIDVDAIRANYINANYIQGLNLNFIQGTIGSFTIDANSISRVVGLQELTLSGSEQEIYFKYNGERRITVTANQLPTLAELNTPASESLFPAFDVTRTGIILGGPYSNLSDSFTVPNSNVTLYLRIRYTKSIIPDLLVDANISGTAFLATTDGVKVKSLGNFNLYSSTDPDQTVTIRSTVEAGTYKILYEYTIRDDSGVWDYEWMSPVFIPYPGTFRLGGNINDDHRVFYTQYRNETFIGRNGFFSYWGALSYFYYRSEPLAGYNLHVKGKLQFSTPNNEFIMLMDPDIGMLIARTSGNLILSGLPTSAPSINNSLYRDSNGFVRIKI